MKSLSIQRAVNTLKSQKKETFLLLIIVGFALFTRLYKISDYMTFLGDEGRDALIVKRMIVDHKFTLLGPTASVGGFYLGPIYYYIMAPFLLLFRLDPTGPAVMVAIFGVLTVFLLFKTAKEFLSPNAAILVSLLYTFSPTVINYSRSSWNPNIMPFFVLLLIYCLIRATKTNNLKYTFVAGLSFGVIIQSHYIGLVMLPIFFIGAFLLANPKKIFLAVLLFLFGSFITFSPFIFFEIRHGFPNTQTIVRFLGQKNTVDGFVASNIVFRFNYLGKRLFETLFSLNKLPLANSLLYALCILLTAILAAVKKSKAIIILLIWLIVGLLGLGSYAGQIYDYYFEFLFPLPFLLLAVVFDIFSKKKYQLMFPVSLTIVLLSVMLLNSPLTKTPNRMLDQAKTIASLVIKETDNKPYNFALMAEHNSDHVYRYFLEIWGHAPTPLEDMVTERLVVVCQLKECSPLGYPLWEIAGFGRAEIDNITEGPIGIKIIRLSHWEGVPSGVGKPAIKGI
jgi:4-amino-4-deoxy-L-arabinose transferase-like glycosyltransferase